MSRTKLLGFILYNAIDLKEVCINQTGLQGSIKSPDFVTRRVSVMVQSTQGRGDSVLDLERQIADEVRNVLSIRELRHVNWGQPSVRTPSLAMPGYVQHSGGITEIAKLSAEAIVREYEAAAKEIEGMGAELIDRVKQCEEMISPLPRR
jgi:hypothetical protein